jgi:hypothetical protein
MSAARWLAILACLLLAAPCPAAPAPETVRLGMHFVKDKTFYQEQTTRTDQTLKLMGTDVVQKQEQTFYFSWTPTGQEQDGSWTLKQRVEGVKLRVDIGGNVVEYDSTTGAQKGAPALAEFFKELVGSEFTVRVDRNKRVLEADAGNLADRLGKANPQSAALLKQILTRDALRQMSESAFGPLPAKAVAAKDRWTRERTLSVGPIGTYRTAEECLYVGTIRRNGEEVHEVTVTSSVEHAPPGDGQGEAPALPFRVKKADLKSGKQDGGVVHYDTTGRLLDAETRLRITGSLTIEIGGQDTTVDLKQDQRTTVRALERLPFQRP